MTKRQTFSHIDKNRISLRRATPSDIELIIEYRIAFLKEVQGCPSVTQESLVRKSLRRYLKKSLGNNTFISWIAEYQNQPVGFSGMVMREQPGSFEIPNGKIGYIMNMFTVKEYRRTGIGSLLFQKLIEIAQQRNLDKIELHTTSEGESLYRKFGFREPQHKVLESSLIRNL
jgi:ribosomal protein S18 acetylase RimI-like enzyme